MDYHSGGGSHCHDGIFRKTVFHKAVTVALCDSLCSDTVLIDTLVLAAPCVCSTVFCRFILNLPGWHQQMSCMVTGVVWAPLLTMPLSLTFPRRKCNIAVWLYVRSLAPWEALSCTM